MWLEEGLSWKNTEGRVVGGNSGRGEGEVPHGKASPLVVQQGWLGQGEGWEPARCQLGIAEKPPRCELLQEGSEPHLPLQK